MALLLRYMNYSKLNFTKIIQLIYKIIKTW